jgi:hypothetical protein
MAMTSPLVYKKDDLAFMLGGRGHEPSLLFTG